MTRPVVDAWIDTVGKAFKKYGLSTVEMRSSWHIGVQRLHMKLEEALAGSTSQYLGVGQQMMCSCLPSL